MNNKLKPALIGGVVLGLLSAIPFVNAVNACCCLWAILGGMLATYLYVRNSATPATAADGAILGSDRKSTRLNSSHSQISYAVFCLKKKNQQRHIYTSC